LELYKEPYLNKDGRIFLTKGGKPNKNRKNKRLSRLKSDLRKLNGLPPYNDMSNICWGDSYFNKSIRSRYSKSEIKQAEKELGLK